MTKFSVERFNKVVEGTKVAHEKHTYNKEVSQKELNTMVDILLYYVEDFYPNVVGNDKFSLRIEDYSALSFIANVLYSPTTDSKGGLVRSIDLGEGVTVYYDTSSYSVESVEFDGALVISDGANEIKLLLGLSNINGGDCVVLSQVINDDFDSAFVVSGRKIDKLTVNKLMDAMDKHSLEVYGTETHRAVQAIVKSISESDMEISKTVLSIPTPQCECCNCMDYSDCHCEE